MKFNIIDFIKSGELPGIKLGYSKHEVLNNLTEEFEFDSPNEKTEYLFFLNYRLVFISEVLVGIDLYLDEDVTYIVSDKLDSGVTELKKTIKLSDFFIFLNYQEIDWETESIPGFNDQLVFKMNNKTKAWYYLFTEELSMISIWDVNYGGWVKV